jgi:hypothetical protein
MANFTQASANAGTLDTLHKTLSHGMY